MKKSQKLMRLAVTSFGWSILLVVIGLICALTIPSEIKNPIEAGLAPLQSKLAIMSVGLSIAFALLGCIFTFYSQRLARSGR